MIPMPMTRKPGAFANAAVLVFGLTVLFGTSRASAAQRYEGLAYASDGDRLLYREIHWRDSEAGVVQHLVLYRCPDGKAFARKRLRESPSATAPDFDFIDGRDDYREGVRTRAGRREVYVQKSRDAPLQAKAITVAADAVIDAGFDAAVRKRWQELANGAGITIPFLLPSRFAFLPLQLATSKRDRIDGEAVQRLRMSVARWYGFALPAIDLAYALDDHRLLEFRGIGTIRGDKGQYLDVRIEFPAADVAPNAPDAELAAADAVPLDGRCVGLP